MAQQFSDAELKKRLTPEQYHVLRERGDEYPGTGALTYNKEKGVYTCPVCGSALFMSDKKYDSVTPGLIGWPSFTDAIDGAIKLEPDNRHGWNRTEVVCSTCGSHLGHYFDDDLSPNGKHYCIASAALDFKKS